MAANAAIANAHAKCLALNTGTLLVHARSDTVG